MEGLARGKYGKKGKQVSDTGKESARSGGRGYAYQELTEPLIRKSLKAIREMNVITPYSLAHSLNVRLSLARKVIKELESSGAISIIAKHHSVIVGLPIKVGKQST